MRRTTFWIMNLSFIAALGATWMNGWLPAVFEADVSFISYVIVLAFAAGLIQAWRGMPGRCIYYGNAAVVLGLIGTVTGFIIAFSGVDAESVSTVAGTTAMVTSLVSGMGVAFYTTLMGAVVYLWLSFVVHLVFDWEDV
jgi:hypothetical protein